MDIFRGRSQDSQAIPEVDEPYDRNADPIPAAETTDTESVASREVPDGELSGPFDAAQVVADDRPRIDFGSMLLPAFDGMEVRLELNDNQEPFAVSVLLDGSAVQLQAFAAPRGEGIWDEIRQEIAEGVRGSNGKATEADGTFGRELRAEVQVEVTSGTQRVRFIGVDGPRWFLRGLISGAGGADPQQSAAVEAVFRNVAVRRGEHAAPPREPLPLQVPDTSELLTEGPSEDDG